MNMTIAATTLSWLELGGSPKDHKERTPIPVFGLVPSPFGVLISQVCEKVHFSQIFISTILHK